MRPKSAQRVVYAEACYLRYRSALFKNQAINDWQKLLNSSTDKPDYQEQTFLLAAAPTPFCDIHHADAICLIRRSWANNLFWDYLATSPILLMCPRVRGVAEGLIYTTLLMGLELKSQYLYLEPSRDALKFYEKLFGDPITDLEKIPIESALTRVESVLNKLKETA